MRQFDVIVLGAGPSGLTAASELARAGARVGLFERAPRAGGLMRGFTVGPYSLDLGRKELYTRFPPVHVLWKALLGDDLQPYPHAVGLFSDGIVMEPRSLRSIRGLSPGRQVRLAASFVRAQLTPGDRTARTVEDYYLLKFGRVFYEFFERGFREKFDGYPLSARALALGPSNVPRFAAVRRGAAPQPSAPAVGQQPQSIWWHPARGTQQIVDALLARAIRAGCHTRFNAEAKEVRFRRMGFRVTLDGVRGTEQVEAPRLVAALPLRALMPLLRPKLPPGLARPPRHERTFHRATVLAYVFARGAPSFRHNWLEVNDRSLQVGRVVNYGSYGGRMVPAGRTALCMEYFCSEGDALMGMSRAGVEHVIRDELRRMRLVKSQQIEDVTVVRLPRTNAATQYLDWRVEWMQRVREYVRSVPGLFDTNRPGLDRATLAGLDAARAILQNARMSPRSLATAHPDPGAPLGPPRLRSA